MHSQAQVYGLSLWYLLQYTPVQLAGGGVGLGEGEKDDEVRMLLVTTAVRAIDLGMTCVGISGGGTCSVARMGGYT